MVINNFVIKIGSQIKDSLCRVFGDGVQYEWRENDDKVIIPDVSIICNLRDRKNISFTGIPRFVMEVLSNATEEYDRHEKMDIYCKVGVSEYWIVDWRKKSVEIYLFEFQRRWQLVIRIFIRLSQPRIKKIYIWLCFRIWR